MALFWSTSYVKHTLALAIRYLETGRRASIIVIISNINEKKFTSTYLSATTFPEKDWMGFHQIWSDLKYAIQGVMTSLMGEKSQRSRLFSSH